jgi:hypothetical protein
MHTYCKNSDHIPGRIYILNSCNELFKLQAKPQLIIASCKALDT